LPRKSRRIETPVGLVKKGKKAGFTVEKGVIGGATFPWKRVKEKATVPADKRKLGRKTLGGGSH